MLNRQLWILQKTIELKLEKDKKEYKITTNSYLVEPNEDTKKLVELGYMKGLGLFDDMRFYMITQKGIQYLEDYYNIKIINKTFK